jgi:hypothetical protein
MNPPPILIKTARILLLIVGSVWFFPVNCTTGLLVGIPVVSELDAWREGEEFKPHHQAFFYLMVETEEGIIPVRIKDLAAFKTEFPTARFLLSQPHGEVKHAVPVYDGAFDRWRYTATALPGEHQEQLGQEITVSYYQADDYSSKSTYRVIGQSITPVYSNTIGPGTGLRAVPLGLMFAFLVYTLARFLCKRLNPRANDQGRAC